MTPRGAVIVGLLCVACGVVPILGGLGVISIKPTAGTPGWIAVCVGVLFVLFGAAVINGYAVAGGAAPDGNLPAGTRFGVLLTSYLLGLGITGLMTTIFGWIAFGPGERHFSSSFSLPFVSKQWGSSDASGRILFGIVAAVSFAIFVRGAFVGARQLRRASQPSL